MDLHWNSFESYTLGPQQLDSFLGERDGIAYFVSHREAGAKPNLIEVVRAGTEHAHAVWESWRRAAPLSHPHLLRPHNLGETTLDGMPVKYAVFDLPDDDLSERLARGPLSDAETRSLVPSLAGTLEHLHAHGLTHGALTASKALFVGSDVKLSVDSLTPLSESAKRADIRELGSIIARIVPDQNMRPYRNIIRGCLDGNWTAARVLSELNGEGKRAAPVRVLAPVAAALVLTLGGWLLYRSGHQVNAERPAFAERIKNPGLNEAETLNATPAASATPAPTKPGPFNPIEPSPVKPAKSQPVQASPAPVHSAPVSDSRSNWAVIAATYNSFEAAEKRAQTLHKEHPRLQASVTPPAGTSKHYYVVLGSGLTHKAAERLRGQALSWGGPPDTYISKIE